MTGLSSLKDEIHRLFFGGEVENTDRIFITNERNRISLTEAKTSLMRVIDSVNSGMPEDFYTVDLLDAYESLGRIIGERISDDLVDEIFKEFCMGK